MKKRIMAVIGTSVCLGLLGGMTAFAANITEQQAKDTVSAYIPSGSTYQRTELDDGNYEVRYYNESKGEKYEFTVSRTSGKILSFESKLYNHHGGSAAKLSQSDAENKVTAEIQGAEIISATLEYDDGTEYEVKFRTASLYGEYVIHPETGSVLEREIKIGENPSFGGSGSSGVNSGNVIGREQVTELAKNQVNGAVVTDVDLEWEHGRYEYEVEMYKDSTKYKLTFDAVTGNLISQKSETEDWSWYHTGSENASSNTSADIGMERAKQIALDRVPGATVRKIERDYDDGRLIYEGELYKDGWEYDFEIDGATGAVLEWEKDND